MGERLPLVEDSRLCYKDGVFSEARYNLLTRKGYDF